MDIPPEMEVREARGGAEAAEEAAGAPSTGQPAMAVAKGIRVGLNGPDNLGQLVELFAVYTLASHLVFADVFCLFQLQW